MAAGPRARCRPCPTVRRPMPHGVAAPAPSASGADTKGWRCIYGGMAVRARTGDGNEKVRHRTNAVTGPNERRKWYHQESNRGHKDFQSFALPTELWHLRLVCGCKGSGFLANAQIFPCKNACVSEKRCTFAPSKEERPQGCRLLRWQRDVAQLVAHYVRDVGVGRSSRLIPTSQEGCFVQKQPFFVSSFKIPRRAAAGQCRPR